MFVNFQRQLLLPPFAVFPVASESAPAAFFSVPSVLPPSVFSVLKTTRSLPINPPSGSDQAAATPIHSIRYGHFPSPQGVCYQCPMIECSALCAHTVTALNPSVPYALAYISLHTPPGVRFNQSHQHKLDTPVFCFSSRPSDGLERPRELT